MQVIKPDIVDGFPVCAGCTCPFFPKNKLYTCWGPHNECIPGLKEEITRCRKTWASTKFPVKLRIRDLEIIINEIKDENDNL